MERARRTNWWPGGIARRFVLAVCAAASLGCYGKPGQVVPAQRPFHLVVENNGYLDVTVYAAESDGQVRMRLGTVTGMSRAVLSVPRMALQGNGMLSVRVHAIGSIRSWLSPEVPISEDEDAVLQLFSNPDGGLTRSQISLAVVRREP